MEHDIVIIGSGVGGGAVAYALASSGARICILERGERLPHEPQNRDAEAVFGANRYRSPERWVDGAGRTFRPGQFYFVGGHTKFYGTAMFRLRERDFDAVEHEEGVSPAWPISYADLEPWYAQAEQLFGVHGTAGLDPTEPPRSGAFPHPAVPHEPLLADLQQRLQRQGLHPFPMPAAIDFGPGGRCERCGTCDAFPCLIDAKNDAETCLVDPALRQPNVRLRTGCRVNRLITDDTGRRVVAAEIVDASGAVEQVRGARFVLAAGAVNSAVLLQRSATARHPQGLANTSGVVGRNYMNHNTSAVLAIDPGRRNTTRFPKTLSINDFYFGGDASATPLGNLQMLGKIQEPMLRTPLRWVPAALRRWVAAHSIDCLAMSEDLPHPDSTVRPLPDGRIELRWHRTNLRAHHRWVQRTRRILRDAGYPLVVTRPFGIETPSHQCGTIRFGTDPGVAALDPYCKAWDHDNLYVIDASFFPSSAAVNPALTVAAQALRAAARLREDLRR
jgi:choline dehydrogenase-like flavoprotein